MDDFEDFESVFSFKSDYAFDHKIIEVISTNRRTLENELFFDRLLRVLGIRQGNFSSACLHPGFLTFVSLSSQETVSATVKSRPKDITSRDCL